MTTCTESIVERLVNAAQRRATDALNSTDIEWCHTWTEKMERLIKQSSITNHARHQAMVCAHLADEMVFAHHVKDIETENSSLGQLLAAVREIVGVLNERRDDIGPLFGDGGHSFYGALKVADKTSRSLVKKSCIEPTFTTVMPVMLDTLRENPADETARAFIEQCGWMADGGE